MEEGLIEVASSLRKGGGNLSAVFCRPRARQLLQLVDVFTPDFVSSKVSRSDMAI
jgi:hypothetical protein